MMTKDEIIGMEALYQSMLKCQKNVMWKPSVSSFSLNWLDRVSKLERELKSGTYKGSKPNKIIVTYPKRRECLGIPFRDRVYQRSLNDNALYPAVTKSFILNNCACQKGKGTDFAINRLRKMLWNFYCHFGNIGYVLHIDIHHYYPTMRHDVAKAEFRKHVPTEIYDMAATVLDSQYSGDVGFNPGSQMVQIAGISVLSPLDHYCKERLRIKYYLRYMDDIIILSHDRNQCEQWLGEIQRRLAVLGFSVNGKKTKILDIAHGFLIFGFTFRLTKTGKVVMLIDSQNIKHEKRKLARMVRLVKKGALKKKKVYDCFSGWLNSHVAKGDTAKVRMRMQAYLKNLWTKEGLA